MHWNHLARLLPQTRIKQIFSSLLSSPINFFTVVSVSRKPQNLLDILDSDRNIPHAASSWPAPPALCLNSPPPCDLINLYPLQVHRTPHCLIYTCSTCSLLNEEKLLKCTFCSCLECLNNKDNSVAGIIFFNNSPSGLCVFVCSFSSVIKDLIACHLKPLGEP